MHIAKPPIFSSLFFFLLGKQCYQKMNVSLGSNITQPKYLRDSFSSAVTKNVIVVGLCISINYINGTLVHTFIKHEIFKGNPRYILFIHMVFNDMIQLMIAVVLHILSYTVFTLNVSFCCVLLMSVIFTTLNTPLNLASMAIERYIAICNPLRHAQICTIRKTYTLIGLIWVLSATQVLPDLFILLATKPITFFYSNIPCIRDYVFDNPYIVDKRNVVYIIYLTFVWLTIVYTYLKIMFIAKATNSDARKARSTIILHGIQLLMCMLTFVGPFLDRLLLEMFQLFIMDTRLLTATLLFSNPDNAHVHQSNCVWCERLNVLQIPKEVLTVYNVQVEEKNTKSPIQWEFGKSCQ